jgi:hypothetical protein
MSDPRRSGQDRRHGKDKETPKTPTTKATAPTPSSQPSSQRTSRTPATQPQGGHAQVTGAHGTPSQRSYYYDYRPVDASQTDPPVERPGAGPALASPTHAQETPSQPRSYLYDYQSARASQTHPPAEKPGARPAAQGKNKNDSSSTTESKAQSFASLGIGSRPVSNYRDWSKTAEPGDVGDQDDFIAAVGKVGGLALGRTTTVPTSVVPPRREESQNTSTPTTPTPTAGRAAWTTGRHEKAQGGRAQRERAEQPTPTRASRSAHASQLHEGQPRGQLQHETTSTPSRAKPILAVLRSKPADERVAERSPTKASGGIAAGKRPVRPSQPQSPTGQTSAGYGGYQPPTEQTPAGYVRQTPTLTESRSQPPPAYTSAAPRYSASERAAGKRAVQHSGTPINQAPPGYGSQQESSSSPTKGPTPEERAERESEKQKMRRFAASHGIVYEDSTMGTIDAKAPPARSLADVKREKEVAEAAAKEKARREALEANTRRYLAANPGFASLPLYQEPPGSTSSIKAKKDPTGKGSKGGRRSGA